VTNTFSSYLAIFLLACASVACGSESESPAQRFGTILVESNSTPQPSQRAVGAFYRIQSNSSGSCYVAEELGACRVWQCDDYAGTATLETSGLSAGTVSVSGTKAPLALEESEVGSYSWDNTLNAPLWAGGEHLVAKVTGSSEFPEMSVTLPAPAPVTAKAPVVPAEEAWTIEASKDLGFAWTGASEGDVYVAVSVSVPAADGGTSLLYPGLDCAFQASLGLSVIPSAALKQLEKPDGSDGYLVELLTFSAEAVRVDDAVVDFRATSFALSAQAQIE
jgi:hypothetical protein